jgi:hypothetical protein
MIALSVTARGEKRLAKLLQGNTKRLRREMAIAVNATSKKTVAIWAKEVSKEVATAQKNIKATIKVSKKAAASESKSPTAVVTQKKTGRIPLRDFGARQNKKGVSYKISKGGKRGFVAGAFQGPKPGAMKASWRGRVFKRVGAGRLPIIQLFGPSPWGVSIKNNLKKPTVKATKIELVKQIERRIRFLKLKQSGAI